MGDRAQAANAVVMVRPHCFFPNPETAADNAFQRDASEREVDALTLAAQREFDDTVETLRAAGVTVHVFDDTESPVKPDAVFPNNWFSTHHDGRIALYPMYSEARRLERRTDIFDALRKYYTISDVVDYSLGEKRGLFLEGTGGLVLDHIARVAYASLSRRASPKLVKRFCDDFGYEPMIFECADAFGQPVYHTNVVMCLGTDFALIGAELIKDKTQRDRVTGNLRKRGTVIELNGSQIADFAGNALELDAGKEKLLVLSERAHGALTEQQRTSLAQFARILPLSLPTIELAGGSARCMIAEIFLPPRQ
jgi:hypothetical protein